ncbi:hypothetical protein CTEN210_18582 [Chaetoceros tenuissimus]|uniref:Uncharacterized protein n=1 Tax=Chaetoceros tenuissimus TaxID=426638 RepID=A0AAD3DF14_9STRA|nr:hypothetical protein CTEN210_18582 [Chaetoceros tenuissimus]
MSAGASRKNPEWDKLLIAAQKNLPDVIKDLVQNKGVSASHSNVINQSALHIACLWGNVEATKALLEEGASVSIQNTISGATPLHSCIQSSKEPNLNRLECAKLLIEYGADVHQKDNFGLRPLDAFFAEYHRSQGHTSPDGKMLIQPVLDFSLEDNPYEYQMLDLLEDTMQQAEDDLKLIPFLNDGLFRDVLDLLENYESDLNVDEVDPKTGQMPINIAVDAFVENCNTDDIDTVHENEATDVLYKVICMLIDKGCTIDAIPSKNIEQTTDASTLAPLYKICNQILDFYSENELNPSREKYMERCKEIAKRMKNKGASMTDKVIQMMHTAARKGLTLAVEFWIRDLQVDPNIKGRQGLTVLHFAARSGKTRVVELLFRLNDELDLSLDINQVDDRGKTALDAAIANGKDDIVELIEAYVDN